MRNNGIKKAERGRPDRESARSLIFLIVRYLLFRFYSLIHYTYAKGRIREEETTTFSFVLTLLNGEIILSARPGRLQHPRRD